MSSMILVLVVAIAVFCGLGAIGMQATVEQPLATMGFSLLEPVPLDDASWLLAVAMAALVALRRHLF